MNDKYAILIYRTVNHDKEYLLVRSVGQTLMPFPIINRAARESNKNAIKRGLKAVLGSEVNTLNRLISTGYQSPGIGYFSISLYAVEYLNTNHISNQYESMFWMNKDAIYDHIAQMSNLMQVSLLPILDEKDLWLQKSNVQYI